MILIGLGSNLTSVHGDSRATIDAALNHLAAVGINVIAQSSYWKTAPVPISDQNWYVNAVIKVETTLAPDQLLAKLHEIEAEFGRVRKLRNEARPIDLDLLDYNGLISTDSALMLPHPRMHERAFVLLPLQEIAPEWVHPASHETIPALISVLPPEQAATLIT